MKNIDENVNLNTVFPAIDELVVDQRSDWHLLLNPKGPTWCVGSKEFAVFTELCDGFRSVGQILKLMRPYFISLDETTIVTIAQDIADAGLFFRGSRVQVHHLSNVSFNLTKVCNLTCPFCYYDSGPNVVKPVKGELTTNEWIDLANRICKINEWVQIYVAGGEPMARHDCLDILNGIAAAKPRKLTLITNGTLLSSEQAKRLSTIPGLIIQVSIDSVVPEENAQTRGLGSLEKALQSVNMLLNEGATVRISTTLTHINKDSTHLIRDYCNELGVRLRTSGFFVGGQRSKNNQSFLSLSADDLWEVMIRDLSRAKANGKHTNTTFHSQIKRQLVAGVPRYTCGVGYGTIAINPDGSVSPCNHLTDQSLGIGNIREQQLEEIITRGYQRYNFVDVDQMPNEGCGGCPMRYLCGGGCKANSYHAYGTMKTPPPDCSFLRRTYAESLWLDLLGPDLGSWKYPSSYDWSNGAQPQPAEAKA